MIFHRTNPPNELFDLMGYFEEVAEAPQENHGGNGGDSSGGFI